MKVKDIILHALKLAGREDIATALENDEVEDGEFKNEIQTALLCFNAVEDELARRYLPLKMSEKFFSDCGEIEFTEFSERPLKILSVKTPAGKCDFEVTPRKLKTCAGEVNVEYNFAPKPKTLDGDSAYTGIQASVALVAAGVASEYCLLSGDAGAANVWETKYRREIDLIQRKKYADAKIPPRRWV